MASTKQSSRMMCSTRILARSTLPFWEENKSNYLWTERIQLIKREISSYLEHIFGDVRWLKSFTYGFIITTTKKKERVQLLHHRFKVFPITQPMFPICYKVWLKGFFTSRKDGQILLFSCCCCCCWDVWFTQISQANKTSPSTPTTPTNQQILLANITCKFYLQILLANFTCKFYLFFKRGSLAFHTNQPNLWKPPLPPRPPQPTCKFYLQI